MTEEQKKPGCPWMVALLVGLPLLYVLSSGPMQTVAFRCHVTHSPDPAGSRAMIAESAVDPGVWWPTFYAPLWWAADQPWGEPLTWYWELFPIRSP
jgi:hypothetical protein